MLETDDVLTVNVPLVCPCGIVILAGTVAGALLLARFTSTPPAAAGAASVTVPMELCPPVTVVGFRLTKDSDAVPALAGFTVNEAAAEFAEVAVI